MKKIFLSAAALAALLAAPVAMADPNDDQPKHNAAKPADSNNNDMKGPAMKGPNDNAMKGPNNGPGGGGNDMRGNGNGDNNANDRMRVNPNDNNNDRTINKTVNKTVVHKTVDRNVILKVRANITAPRRFHPAKAYVRPAGWYQHRWVYGEHLPRTFFAPDYFILDFSLFGLMSPWDGYEWVRYGDDALLIDVDTGEVIRVEYGLFE